MNTESTVSLLIAGGGDLRQLLAHAIGLFPRVTGRVTIAIANRELMAGDHTAGSITAGLLQQHGCEVNVLCPPASTAGAWGSVRRTEWVAVELPRQAERLDRAWLPAPISRADCLIAVNTLSTRSANRDPIALGLWAKFAHPRQRTGARLSTERDGLTAEIALAVNPSLILLTGEWRGLPFVFASCDQIAVELAAISFAQTTSKTPPESGGPWEYPLVQHAAELGVGISRPGQIRPIVYWAGGAESQVIEAFNDFATDLLARMGVTLPE